MATQDLSLPQLRPDLEVTRGPADEDGSPTYVIYDPVSNRYFWLGWAEKEIVSRLVRPRKMSELLAQLRAETTLRPTSAEVSRFWLGMTKAGLTLGGLFRGVPELTAMAQKNNPRFLLKLFRRYLYYRKHLLNPDRFLAKALPYARPLASAWFLLLVAAIAITGLVLVTQRWETYLANFSQVFNFGGLLAYALTIAAVKVIHELSHGLAAKACGLRVPSMGVAFILLWPLIYCDVSSSWRLTERRKRMIVSLAGVLAELLVAGLSLSGWALSQEGSTARNVFFILSSTSLLSSLLINLNPAMKFDGYFILMDFIGVDNLQSRAFAYTRWLYRARLLGMNLPCPERRMPGPRRAALVLYTLLTWVYRLFLYLAISLLIYSQLTKTLGIFFFTLAIWNLLLRPIANEIKEIAKDRKGITLSWRLFALGAVALGGLLYIALPLPHHESFPAIRTPHSDQVIYAPADGFLRDVAVRREQRVPAGQRLARIEVPALDALIKETELKIKYLEQERNLILLYPRLKGKLPLKNEEIKQHRAELSRLQSLADQNNLFADFAGIVYDWDTTLRPGMAINKDRVLGRIAMPNRAKVLAYVPEQWIGRLNLKADPVFVGNNDAKSINCRFVTFCPVCMETLQHPALATPYGGEIEAVLDKQGRISPLKTYFVLELEQVGVSRQAVVVEQQGRLNVSTRPYSLLAQWLRQMKRALIRESSF